MNVHPEDALDRYIQSKHSRRDFIRRAGLLGLSVPVVASVLAACGGEAATTPDTGSEATPTATSGPVTVDQNVTPSPTTAAAATPTTDTGSSGSSGGSVILARGTDSENLDPVTQDGNINIWPFLNIYDPLIKIADSGTELIPELAEKWDVSDDGTEYTFTLRQGVKFYDGTPLKVSDVVWSLERARTHEESVWTFSLDQVTSISAVDDSNVLVTLKDRWAPFLADISMFNSVIISEEFAKQVGEDKLVDQTMGTGPFHLKEWKKGESMTLVKNPNYWEPGLPKLDEITLVVIPDSNSRTLQLKGGSIDGIIGQGDIALNTVPDLESDPNLVVHRFISTWNNFVVFNTRNAPLNDVKVRQALNYATDKQAIIDVVLFGNAEISNSFMPRGALFWNPDQPGYPFNVEQAQQLMAESSVPDGFTLEFMVLAGNQQQLQIATALKDMWSKIGVDLDILQLEQGVLNDNYRNNNFQARLTGWTNDIIDPDQLISYAILPEQTENYRTGWVNQEAVDLANQARLLLDPEERRPLYHRIQEIHMEDAPWVYLYVMPYVDVLHKKVKDYFHHPMGQWVFKNMYVEE